MADEYTAVNKHLTTYTTFSGADIVATFGGITVGELSGITFSVTREKVPIYTMGSPNPRSFSRGKRGIAGSLIFTVFDKPALYRMISENMKDNPQYFYTRTHNALPNQGLYVGRGIADVGRQSRDIMKVIPYYADQIPPFDITITFANEYGQAAARSIYGVELLNEGSGASMDDIMLEEAMTYVARELGPMYTINREILEDQATLSDIISNDAVSSGGLNTEIIRP